eukprot:scaffold119437_cov46-Cyclotella_meneghiniana.AAC.1
MQEMSASTQGLLPEIYPTPDTRSDRIPDYLPDLCGTGLKIPEYLPVYSLITRVSYMGSAPRF